MSRKAQWGSAGKPAHAGTGGGPPEKSGSGTTSDAYGSAVAVGENTLATSDVSMTMKVHGRVTKVDASVTSTASASSPDGESVYASAYSGVDVANADIYISKTTVRTSGDFSYQTSTTTVKALNLPVNLKNPVRVEKTTSIEVSDAPGPPEGNLATFNVDVDVYGENTLAYVSTDALALEDQLSTSTVNAYGATSGGDWWG
jgi:hypothetical protein